MMELKAVVEGNLDAAVAERLGREVGFTVTIVRAQGGKGEVLRRLPGYNHAARNVPGDRWLVMCDLDRQGCAPELIRTVLPERSERMCFRVAVRSVESWLLADPQLKDVLRLRSGRLPANPDAEEHPKSTLRALARRSRSRSIVRDVAGVAGRHAPGPKYDAFLGTFARTKWDPRLAAAHSDSLARALMAIEQLAVQ